MLCVTGSLLSKLVQSPQHPPQQHLRQKSDKLPDINDVKDLYKYIMCIDLYIDVKSDKAVNLLHDDYDCYLNFHTPSLLQYTPYYLCYHYYLYSVEWLQSRCH